MALLAVAFVGFLLPYPKQDGDNIKALYVLNALPVLAIAAAYSLESLARWNSLGRAVAVVVVLAVAVPTAWFVVLPPG